MMENLLLKVYYIKNIKLFLINLTNLRIQICTKTLLKVQTEQILESDDHSEALLTFLKITINLSNKSYQ